jgi:type II secretory pathway component PulF
LEAFCLGHLLKSGMRQSRALAHVAEAIPGDKLRDSLIMAARRVDDGESLDQALRQGPRLAGGALLRTIEEGNAEGNLGERLIESSGGPALDQAFMNIGPEARSFSFRLSQRLADRVPPEQALSESARGLSEHFQAGVAYLLEEARRGSPVPSLANAMRRAPQVFSPDLVMLVELAEESNALVEMLAGLRLGDASI